MKLQTTFLGSQRQTFKENMFFLLFINFSLCIIQYYLYVVLRHCKYIIALIQNLFLFTSHMVSHTQKKTFDIEGSS